MLSALILGWMLGTVGAAEPDAVKPPDLAAYQAAKAGAGRDADAHVALALWCEAHGMAAEKAKHLARAVLIDPSNAKARGLLGYVQHDGKWMRPEDVSKAVEESPEAQALFREYQDRRIKSRNTADDQYKLAKWCDEHGLTQQATAHYRRVVELDSGREGAWRRLGFKKISGRWAKPELEAARKAEREAQARADKLWRSRLSKLKDDLSGRDKAKKAEALEEIARIDDPRAVPMVWRIFALDEERWQRVSLRIFSQIDSPRSSIALATMAMFVPSADLRAEASQVLLRRDPRDYAGMLVGLLQDEVEYKVRAVNGPGSQGELFIKGKGANVDRLYRPMQGPPQLPPGWVTLDDWGFPVVKLYFGSYTTRSTTYTPPAADASGSVAVASQSPQLAALMAKAGLATQTPVTTGPTQTVTAWSRPGSSSPIRSYAIEPYYRGNKYVYTPAQSYDVYTKTSSQDVTMSIPIGWMMMQARESAAVAQQQLADDVRRIDEYNTPIRTVNERARQLLKSASGFDAGSKRESWEKWFVDFAGYTYSSQPEPEPPTIVQNVPIDYQPAPIVVSMNSQVSSSQVNATHVNVLASVTRNPSCFAAGTLVHTLRGDRPIEEVRAGDLMLTQDTTTGKMDYQPVVTVFHNPPNTTYRIDLGSESVYPTGIHRFWKSGRGWIMARDVKAGDRLRTIGGTVEVVSASKDKVQPVFNLLLEGGDNYCVGGLGVLAHDNGFVEPVEHPFDGVPALAGLATTKP